jgi:hypothetical protein
MKKIPCIQILNGCIYEMSLMESDKSGYYQYLLTPTELGYAKKTIYIAPDRKDHIISGKHVAASDVLYCHMYASNR